MIVLHVFLQNLVVFQMNEAEHEIRKPRSLPLDADGDAGIFRLDVQQDKGALAEVRPELHDGIQHAVRRIGIQAVDRHTAVKVGEIIFAQHREIEGNVLSVAARKIMAELQLLVIFVFVLQVRR